MNEKPKFFLQNKLANSDRWEDCEQRPDKRRAMATRDAKRYLDKHGIDYRVVMRLGGKDTVLEREV